MRNLIAFLTKYSFFFLFLFLEVIAFYLIIQHNSYQKSSFINTANSLSSGIYESFSNATDYFALKEANEQLAKENAMLKERQLSAYAEIFGDNLVLNDTIYSKKYLYVEAKVINNSTNKQNNYLILDKGSLNGIQPGMGVVGSKGIVGIVKNVSENYSSVLSILHSRSSISAKLMRTSYFGSMKWDGKSYRNGVLNDIPNHVFISLGDTVVTSGFSSIFPDDIPIATILDFEKPEGENFYDIKLRFINDFKKISYVYVVKNIQMEEIQDLENLTNESDAH